MTGSITREGDMAVIRIPMAEVHALRVALKPIRVGEPTSTSAQGIRDRLDRALARLEAGPKR